MDAGYLGVGNMGLPMAAKLIDAGHSLTIYDISESAMQPLLERQARRAASPKDSMPVWRNSRGCALPAPAGCARKAGPL